MTPDTFDRAEAYLGELTDAQRAELVRDPALAAEVARLRGDVAAIRARAARQAIAAAGKRHAGAPRIRRRPRRQLRRALALAVAAAAVLAVVLWVGGFLGADAPPAAAFAPAIGLPTTLGDAEDRAFAEGMVDYKLGDYAAALARWEPLLAARPADDTLAFYTAVSLIAEGREDAAAALLLAVDDPALAEQRDWFLTHAYRRARRSDRAEALLTRIAGGGGRYAAEAQTVLDEGL